MCLRLKIQVGLLLPPIYINHKGYLSPAIHTDVEEKQEIVGKALSFGLFTHLNTVNERERLKLSCLLMRGGLT